MKLMFLKVASPLFCRKSIKGEKANIDFLLVCWVKAYFWAIDGNEIPITYH